MAGENGKVVHTNVPEPRGGIAGRIKGFMAYIKFKHRFRKIRGIEPLSEGINKLPEPYKGKAIWWLSERVNPYELGIIVEKADLRPEDRKLFMDLCASLLQ